MLQHFENSFSRMDASHFEPSSYIDAAVGVPTLALALPLALPLPLAQTPAPALTLTRRACSLAMRLRSAAFTPLTTHPPPSIATLTTPHYTPLPPLTTPP